MTDLVLASGSKIRAKLLSNAGLFFRVIPADVDEAPIKDQQRSEGAQAAQIAETLAHRKALQISQQDADAYVIGADQVLVFDDEIFDKPKTMDEAASHLRTFRGSTHSLISAACVAKRSRIIWTISARADLTMRPFSETFLDGYLSDFGDTALTSVGGYHLEGSGAQLFERIEGDYFTILGLPLIELLAFLRMEGMLPE